MRNWARTMLWISAVGALALGCGGSTSTGGTGGSGNASGSGGSGNVSGGGGSGNASGSGGSGNVSGGGGSGNVSGSGGSAGSSTTSCNEPGSCVLFATNCCGGFCGEVPLSSYLAVSSAHLAEVQQQMCTPQPPCTDCATFDDPNYFAACRTGQCTGVDLRTDSLSSCTTNTDCRLRWGSGCCESCGGNVQQLVSYAASANLEAEVCPANGPSCPPCIPQPYPSYAMPACVGGHCQVLLAGG